MITHDNITWTSDTIFLTLPRGTLEPHDVMISYLPLSHIAAQVLDMHGAMLGGYQLYFAQADALKGTLVNTMREARPTVFFGVPRVWEKMYGTLCMFTPW